MIVVDPYADFAAIREASYVNIPVIALCDTHNNLQFVDFAIPCNNNNTYSIAMIFWMLAREVLVLRGKLDQNNDDWNDVMVDLLYYKNIKSKPEKEETEENDEAAEENDNNNEKS